MRVRSFLSIAGFFAAAALWGCGGGAGTTSMPGAALQPEAAAPQSIGFSEDGFTDMPFDGASSVGVRLSGEKAITSKPYGRLLGYAKGVVTKTTQVVTLAQGAHVIFHNVDSSLPHTASLLGDATKKSAPWPQSFNGSSNPSKAGTDISTPGFSTGAMSAGKSSLTYVANVPGFYMFGCAFHYDAFGMRDIIIVR